MKKHNQTESEREIISTKIRDAIIRDFPSIISAYIYGSFIGRGEFGDIDLGILIEINRDDVFRFELELEKKLEEEVHLPIDVRVLNHAPISFVQNVIRQGRLVVDRDAIAREIFTGRVLKQYFDFASFHKRYLKEVIHAPL